ncbi:MAG TPA: GntR family transcriptional regulator [Planctomycetota bacterium]|nr:GntR family transcriptional regulator [Planctomycetota bacterium]
MARKKGYKQIAEEVKAQIDAGKLTQGQRLPTILLLAQEHGVAEMTVRRAIDILKRQKLISAITGQGIFVNRTGKKVLVLFHGAQPHPNDQSFQANGFIQKFRDTLTGEGHQVEVAYKSKAREVGGPDVNSVYEKINEADLVLAFGIMDETYLQRMYALCGPRPNRAGNPDPLQMSARKPLVTIDYAPLMVDTTAVVVDSFAAGFHCTQSLIGTGCNRIAYLGHIRPEHPVGSPDNDSLLREAGVIKAVREAGLRPASEAIQHAKPADMPDAIRRILAAPNPPNGWVCYSLQEVTQLKTCAQENGQNPSKLRIASCAYAESFPQLREHASVQWRYFDQNEVLGATVTSVLRLLADPQAGNTRQVVKVLSQLPRRSSIGRRRKAVVVAQAERSGKASTTLPAGS